ncbi:sensor histidine kinase [Actinoplanes sp. CA-142083]|uniref:sensor histidine kinase n=1 Tax=Actinoplanes sp. CA-142083 TaxID=3239903 RepID=UPI003D91378B
MRELTGEARARESLRRQNRALAELVATRTELVSAMLHELRTPLASTLAMVEMLPADTGDAQLDEALELIARNVRRIAGVTEQIATISGMENGTLPISRKDFDLAALLSKHGFAVESMETFAGDRDRLNQVFARLVEAVRALGGAGRMTASTDGDHWRIALPLPPDLVTDRLFTGANATALMFARAVVGRHGGTVGVESASLVVSLPRSARPPGSADPAP